MVVVAETTMKTKTENRELEYGFCIEKDFLRCEGESERRDQPKKCALEVVQLLAGTGLIVLFEAFYVMNV